MFGSEPTLRTREISGATARADLSSIDQLSSQRVSFLAFPSFSFHLHRGLCMNRLIRVDPRLQDAYVSPQVEDSQRIEELRAARLAFCVGPTAEEIRSLRQAAKQGDIEARLNVARLYARHQVPRELCLLFALEYEPNDSANTYLGSDKVYAKHGCKEAAAYWYNLAAQQGSEAASWELAELEPLLELERAKRTVEWSGGHLSCFDSTDDACNNCLADAVNVLRNAGYTVVRDGAGYAIAGVQ